MLLSLWLRSSVDEIHYYQCKGQHANYKGSEQHPKMKV